METWFVVFAGANFYPRGGAGDFKGALRTLEAATIYAASIEDEHEWVEIVKFKFGRLFPVVLKDQYDRWFVTEAYRAKAYSQPVKICRSVQEAVEAYHDQQA